MPQNDDNNLVIDLGVLSAEPADEYHAKAGEYLSSHQLLDFMACPWLYRKKQLGLISDGDTPALLVGLAPAGGSGIRKPPAGGRIALAMDAFPPDRRRRDLDKRMKMKVVSVESC